MPRTRNDDISLYYDIAGRGEPVLWLQGLGADHTAWTVQVARFSRHYRCILPDNRDTGLSERASQPYTIGDLAEDMRAVLDAASEESAHVVGLSMGASVAQELALQAPERVRSLTLLSALPRADARLRTLLGLWVDLYHRLGRMEFYRHAEPWLFSPGFFEQPSNLRALRRYVEQEDHPQEPEAFARQVEASLTHDTAGRLGQIRASTLVVSGEHDIMVPPDVGRRLAEGIPGARYELLPAVAHSVNLEMQRSFNQLLEGFLAECEATRNWGTDGRSGS